MKLALVTTLLLVGCGRSGFDDITTGDGAIGGNGDGGNGDGGNGGGGDGASGDAASAVLSVTISHYNPGTIPPPRRSSGAALDPATDLLWFYGGYDGTFRGDVQAFSTGGWTIPATSGTSPGARERHALAWDPVGNALVIFGGQNRPMIQLVHYDTLHVMTTGSVFAPIPKTGTWPAARKDATLLWIPHLSRFLLYGGDDGAMASNRFADLWLLTLNSAAKTATWQALTPGGVAAPAQSSACVVYDPAAHRMILFGGETADGVDVNTTYQYLLDTNVWQQDTTTGTPPAGESFAQCAWDPTHNRVLLYGGQQNGGTPIGGYATYDPDAHVWAVPPSAAGIAGNRSDGGAVFSATLGGMLWYGGRTGAITYTSDVAFLKLQ